MSTNLVPLTVQDVALRRLLINNAVAQTRKELEGVDEMATLRYKILQIERSMIRLPAQVEHFGIVVDIINA